MREALRVFFRRGSLNAAAWAALYGLCPVHAADSYLGALERAGLLERKKNARQLVLFRLSDRGRIWIGTREGKLGKSLAPGPKQFGVVLDRPR